MLLVAPTGAGKSLVYLVGGVLTDGPTLVVSPLLALQQDQIDRIEAAPGNVHAARISSAETERQRDEVLARAADGEVDFLFLAPEQLANDEVRRRLAGLGPGLVAVDEAHCVSAWGHDFRPDYLRLGELVGQLGAPRVVAMTATAAPPVRDDIVERLRLRRPAHVRDRLRPAEHRPRGRSAPPTSRNSGPGCWTRSREGRASSTAAPAGRPRSTPPRSPTRGAGRGLPRRAGRPPRAGGPRGVHGGRGRRRGRHLGVRHGDRQADSGSCARPGPGVAGHLLPGGRPRRARRGGRPRATLVYRPEDLALGRFFSAPVPRPGDVERCWRPRPPSATEPAQRSPSTRGSARARSAGSSTCARMSPADGRQAAATRSLAGDSGGPRRDRSLERSRVEMMRGYAETDRCRTEFLVGYFGERLGERCGVCDNCRAGVGAEPAERRGRAVRRCRREVRHEEFGEGVVTDLEEDRLDRALRRGRLPHAVARGRGRAGAARPLSIDRGEPH